MARGFTPYYVYDAWGRWVYYIQDTEWSNVLGGINPLLYRGYVYDHETQLYYLQSRYYDFNTHRFLNADAFISTGQGFTGNNMFAYCLNSPVNLIDIGGMVSADYYSDDGELMSSKDLGEGGGSRFSAHFGSGSGGNKPWYSVIESSSAFNSTKGLKADQYQQYENALNKLAQGDGTGLTIHGSKGGLWSADVHGFGKGRGNGRILFELLDGVIYIIEVTIKHFKN